MNKGIDLINEFTEEFIEYAKKGETMTAEFATKPEHLAEIAVAMNGANKILADFGAYWRIVTCSACQKHHGEEYFCHVEICKE